MSAASVTPSSILVLGATGHQGGAVVRALLSARAQLGPTEAAKFKIRAMTRNVNGPNALKLKEQGVDEIVQGDMDDEVSLRGAMQGAYGVYAVTPYEFRDKNASEREIAQGKRIALAAAEAGVKHFVFSSVCSADNAPDVAHFQSKWTIEQYIHELGERKGLQWTILRPAAFMDMLHPRPMATFMLSAMRAHMSQNKKLQFVATDDIGHFARLSFENPKEYIGKTISLVGDELSRDDIVATYQRVLGTLPWTLWIPTWTFRVLMKELSNMFNWFENVGYNADIASLRRAHPKLKSLEDMLSSQKKE